jgi:hypothetical protein
MPIIMTMDITVAIQMVISTIMVAGVTIINNIIMRALRIAGVAGVIMTKKTTGSDTYCW